MNEQTNQQKQGFLANKKVILLGGSAGIGLATAKAATAEGAQVIIVSSNTNRLNAALKELPDDSIGYTADLRDEHQVKDLFARLGSFDHLVFTAGEELKLVILNNMTIEEARNFFNLRYWGALTAVKYAAPNINEGGSIVLTGGVAANRPLAGWSLGASICAAMEGLTRALAIELAPVRVNLVSPGVVQTDLWGSMPDSEREAFYEHMAATLPIRHTATAAEIADSYLYLMKQTYSTGQVIVVDGGAVLV